MVRPQEVADRSRPSSTSAWCATRIYPDFRLEDMFRRAPADRSRSRLSRSAAARDRFRGVSLGRARRHLPGRHRRRPSTWMTPAGSRAAAGRPRSRVAGDAGRRQRADGEARLFALDQGLSVTGPGRRRRAAVPLRAPARQGEGAGRLHPGASRCGCCRSSSSSTISPSSSTR